MDRFDVHDLLRIGAPSCLRRDDARPQWVQTALKAAPWVVVRRIAAEGRLIAVGVRGVGRGQRWADWVAADEVVDQLRPQALTARLSDLSPSRLAAAPALAAAAALDAAWRKERAPPSWGPTGSVGFELASGRPTVGAQSDLDAIILCPKPATPLLAQAWLATIVAATAPQGARADVLLETPQGAVALVDYARDAPPVMLRTKAGPRLVDDPWAAAGVPA